jgi:hypothetical protein
MLWSSFLITLNKAITRHPIRVLFLYSLLAELLILLSLLLALLLTAEIVLPGFISLRINLTWYVIALLTLSTLLIVIGKKQNIYPLPTPRLEKTALFFGGIWGTSIITLSLYRFPWWTILLIFIILVIMGYQGYRFFFKPHDA